MKDNQIDIENIKEKVNHCFSDSPEVLAVFLLGSAARGELNSSSDIDLAVMAEPGSKLDIIDRVNYANSLSYEFLRTVDIGEISSSNLVYSREALLKGIPVYQTDPDKVNLYRANLLGMYIQYNRDRREVLDAYRAG